MTQGGKEATVEGLAGAVPLGQSAPLDRKARARQAMLTGPILPTLLRLALPTLSVMIAQTCVGIVETYYVGLLGTDALAGVALVFPVFMLMMTMSAGGIGSGVASAVARAIGAGRERDADALVLHALVLALVFGLLFAAAAFCAGPMLYEALGGQGEALHGALRYSNYLFGGAVALWTINLLAAALRGAGNVKVPALVSLGGALVLIPVSPALIFGFGPIPRLGIAGAGLAVVLYYSVAALVLLRYLAAGRSGLALRLAPLKLRLFADILGVGLPTAFSAALTNLTVILVTGAVGLLGVKALAAYGIASRLDYILIPILFGLSSAVLTMVGVNRGAGNSDRARRIVLVSALIGVAVTEGIGLLVAFAPSLWAGLFSHDPAVLEPAETFLRIVGPAYGFLGLGFVISFAAQGAGQVFWPVVAVALRLLVAAGLGWLAVARFDAGFATLGTIVAAGLAVYAGVCALALRSPAFRRVP